MTDLSSLFNQKLLSNQDLTQLKETLEDEYAKAETGKKFTAKYKSDTNFYLPDCFFLWEFLGFKFNLANIVGRLEAVGAEPLNIRRSSLYALEKNGVGVRTYKKLTDWAINNFASVMELVMGGVDDRFDLSFKANSTVFSWLIAFKSMDAFSSIEDDVRPEYIYFLEFLKQRCSVEFDFIEYVIKNNLQELASNPDKRIIWWGKYAKPFWIKNSALSLDCLSGLDRVMEDPTYIRSLGKKDISTFLVNFLRSKYDFLFSAIAHFEIGDVITQCSDDDEAKSMVGIFGWANVKYVEDTEGGSCFNYVLEAIKTAEGVSWRKLASYIEVNEAEGAENFEDSLNDKQYRRLKDWRKGINLPSTQLLLQFCNNLAGDYLRDILFIYCRIAIGIDNIKVELEAEFTKEAESIWKEVLSYYNDDYYQHYLSIGLLNKGVK